MTCWKPICSSPEGSPGGPYRLILGVEETRLALDIALEDGTPHGKVLLSLAPLRKTVKDYFLVCENYYKAIRTAPPHQIEALDMARRTLHDEGARELQRAAGRQGGNRFRHRAAAVHAGLRAADAGLSMEQAVLIACTMNAVRSPMAAAMLRHLARPAALCRIGRRAGG